MTFGSSFGRTFSPTFQPSSQAAKGGGWWDLNGTITSCVAAYQPKGAASYAASLVNLTGNTDYDATEGNGTVTWDATNGWQFTTAAAKYLTPNHVPSSGGSCFVRFANATYAADDFFVGLFDGNLLRHELGYINSKMMYTNGGYNTTTNQGSASVTSGVMGTAGSYGYLDGSVDTPQFSVAWKGDATHSWIIGGRNTNGTPSNFITGNILAVAKYSTTLTSTQISDLTTAMAAL